MEVNLLLMELVAAAVQPHFCGFLTTVTLVLTKKEIGKGSRWRPLKCGRGRYNID